MDRASETGLERSLLRSLLEARLLLTKASRRIHPSGFSTPDELIPTHRYILILRGRLKYQVEEKTADLKAPTLIYVPAWVRRRWWVPAGEICENLWCEFSVFPSQAIPPGLFHAAPPLPGLERAALTRILQLWKNGGGEAANETANSWTNLQMEGELKASLARFWPQAKPGKIAGTRTRPGHPAVLKVLAWMENNYSDPEAASLLLRETDLSPNHFRLIFHQQTGMSPARQLKEIRMRHARGLLHQSHRPVKDIAAAAGYADPLHFTRQYHRFWGHPPTRDRGADPQG